jgi:hypothetical protein
MLIPSWWEPQPRLGRGREPHPVLKSAPSAQKARTPVLIGPSLPDPPPHLHPDTQPPSYHHCVPTVTKKPRFGVFMIHRGVESSRQSVLSLSILTPATEWTSAWPCLPPSWTWGSQPLIHRPSLQSQPLVSQGCHPVSQGLDHLTLHPSWLMS